ncbi:hypothetical protein J4E91_005131 [Alternaria rosae]|nr:hypothetical protein J4E91_005131 [Alternaria rosae]
MCFRKNSGKIIVALNPIPFEFLQEDLVHQEQAELATKIDANIRSAKPNHPQAAVSFALEESIKRICRLDITKKAKKGDATSGKPSMSSQPELVEKRSVLNRKKAGALGSSTSVTSSKPYAPSQAMPVRIKMLDENKTVAIDTLTSVPPPAAGPSKNTQPKSVERSNVLEGSKASAINKSSVVLDTTHGPSQNDQSDTLPVEGCHGLCARGGPPTTTLEACLYRHDTFTRLAKIAADPYHKTLIQGPEASHSRRVSFSPNVKYGGYDEDSPPSASRAAAKSKVPSDNGPGGNSLPEPGILQSLYDVPDALNSIPKERLIRCVDEVMAQGTPGINELDAQLLYVQCAIPYGDRAYQCAWAQQAQESIIQAHAAIDDACQDAYHGSGWLKQNPVMKAIVATALAQRLLEIALLRVNDPAYSKAYLTAYGRG